MAGIHLHPHDILDEGVDSVLERINKMNGVDSLFVEVNTIFERNPYPTGRLPHNPKHEFVQGTASMSNSICRHYVCTSALILRLLRAPILCGICSRPPIAALIK